MGNDVSLQKSVYIDEKATEVTPYWSMYHGEWRRTENITNHLSVFKSESSSEETAEDQFWRRRNPLEKAGKVIMSIISSAYITQLPHFTEFDGLSPPEHP